MLKMRFLLDENVHHGLFGHLKKLGHDMKECPKGIENGDVFRLSVKENRMLISRDSDFLAPHFREFEHPGIILIRIAPEDLESQIRAVSNLLNAHQKSQEFRGRCVKILPDESFEFE